ncbi:hypothetical protein Dimus_024589 [Dionaea muscipula]
MQEKRLSRRLVLFPFSFRGHMNPMLQLGSILYSKGFSISVIHTSFNQPNSADHPHLTFHCIDVGLSESEIAMASSMSITSILSPFNNRCSEPFRECLSSVIQSSKEEEEPVACLIIDVLWYFSPAVAESLGLPTMILRSCSIAWYITTSAMPLMVEKGFLPVKDDSDLDSGVPGFAPLKFKDLPVAKKGTNLDNFIKQLSISNRVIKASRGVIVNTFEELENCELSKNFHDSFPVPTFSIGPFHKFCPAPPTSVSSAAQDKSCISWLDKQAHNSVLYVSFGSLAKIGEAQFLEIAWGLAHCNQPFLWVIRPGLVHGLGKSKTDEAPPLPDGFVEMVGERGLIVKWARQLEVLAHPAVGGFWTHNGWNSTLESVSEGVPMICTPNFADQMINARYVSDVWKVGILLEIEKLQRGEIEMAIRRLMLDEEGEVIRERMNHLKLKAHHSCLAESGSSLKSLENLATYLFTLLSSNQ